MSDLPPSPAQGDAIASQSVVLSRDYTSIRSIYGLARPSPHAHFLLRMRVSALVTDREKTSGTSIKIIS